jgi:hypothetical protein
MALTVDRAAPGPCLSLAYKWIAGQAHNDQICSGPPGTVSRYSPYGIAGTQANGATSILILDGGEQCFASESKPGRWRFFRKNSATEISRWRPTIFVASMWVVSSLVIKNPTANVAVTHAGRLDPGQSWQFWETVYLVIFDLDAGANMKQVRHLPKDR